MSLRANKLSFRTVARYFATETAKVAVPKATGASFGYGTLLFTGVLGGTIVLASEHYVFPYMRQLKQNMNKQHTVTKDTHSTSVNDTHSKSS